MFVGFILSGGLAAAEQITLQFWSPFPAGDLVSPTATLQKLVNEFNETHSDIKVEHRGFPVTELHERYLLAFAGGTFPDIGWGTPLEVYSTEVLVPLDTLAERDGVDTSQFWPGLWGGFATVYGRQWGYPFEVGAQGLIYNANHFNAAGIAGPPKTWREFLQIAKKLTDPEAGRFALQPVWAPLQQISWVWRARGRVLSEDGTKVTFTDPQTVDAVQWIGELESVHGVTGGSVPDQTASMIVVHPGWYGFSRTFDFEVGYSTPPVPVGGQQATMSYYQELTITRSNPEREKAAWTFVKWLMSPENIVRWNINTGYLPTSRAVVETAEYHDWLSSNPGMRPWLEMLNYLRDLPRLPGLAKIPNLFMEALNEVRTGQASARSALSAREEAAQAILDEVLAEASKKVQVME